MNAVEATSSPATAAAPPRERASVLYSCAAAFRVIVAGAEATLLLKIPIAFHQVGYRLDGDRRAVE